MAFLQVKNIKKKFGDLQVLKGINFELNSGEVVSIIGSSGNGKTTFLRCLNFLEKANEGEIYVDGQLIFDATKKYSDTEFRKMNLIFGMVFQNFNLFPQYTALQNVCLAMNLQAENKLKDEKVGFARRKTLMKQVKEENSQLAKDILVRVGLGDKLNYYPCQLSGGQQQRVAIARALALKPKILCFDEPTSALDPELTGEVLKVIKELKSPEIAMIIVTHEMQFAREVSDKIIFMSEGEIEEMGTPEQIFNSQNAKTNSFLKNFIE